MVFGKRTKPRSKTLLVAAEKQHAESVLHLQSQVGESHDFVNQFAKQTAQFHKQQADIISRVRTVALTACGVWFCLVCANYKEVAMHWIVLLLLCVLAVIYASRSSGDPPEWRPPALIVRTQNVLGLSSASRANNNNTSSEKSPILSGHLGNLDCKQQQALDELKVCLLEKKYCKADIERWMCGPAETVDLLCLRFLRARQFDVKAAFSMLSSDVEWRQGLQLDVFRDKAEHDVLPCPPSVLQHYAPQFRYGHDKEGRPVIYKFWCNANIKQLCAHLTIEEMHKHHLWSTEQVIKLLSAQSATRGENIETWTIVMVLFI